jgi:hypothetical protein
VPDSVRLGARLSSRVTEPLTTSGTGCRRDPVLRTDSWRPLLCGTEFSPGAVADDDMLRVLRGHRDLSKFERDSGTAWPMLRPNLSPGRRRPIRRASGPCMAPERTRESTRTSRNDKRTSQRSMRPWTSLRANCSSRRSDQDLIDRDACATSSLPSGKAENRAEGILPGAVALCPLGPI